MYTGEMCSLLLKHMPPPHPHRQTLITRGRANVTKCVHAYGQWQPLTLYTRFLHVIGADPVLRASGWNTTAASALLATLPST